MTIAIIGGGAAGFFAAINLKGQAPSAQVTLYESGTRVLAKVAVTGGGRCNLTNSFEGLKSLAAAYPRGEKLMKRAFRTFDHRAAYDWFEGHGIRLTTQEDGCVFPRSQDAMEIVEMLTRCARRLGVEICIGHRVQHIARSEADGRFDITFADETKRPRRADAVVVTTGGSPKREGLAMLDAFDLKIIPPVPSLFSFNLPDQAVTELMGTVVDPVSVALQGTKFRTLGALLITHWGMSGPAILKLSAHAARELAAGGYDARLSVNWYGERCEAEVTADLEAIGQANPQKQLSTAHPQHLPARLWLHLLHQSSLPPERRWCELGKKGQNKLINTLTNDTYHIQGKSRFKEEFVTCGGVALDNINPSTLECRTAPGLYFAGEVLDIDAITGGFNLQAAWTTGYLVAKALTDKIAGGNE